VIPELQGKLTGMAFRVPAVDMCIIDLTVKLQRTVTYEQVVEKMREYERGELKGLLRVCDDEIVSSDLIGDVHSCIFDARSGIALNGSFMKLIAWTDNEVAYSTRMLDLIHFIATRE
jgi:glyceraldehyde 3-phosphate dehydrogenase